MSLIAGNLAVVQRLLDGSALPWGVFAGAAAHLYGNRRPLQDVDLLVPKGQLSAVVQLLQGSGKAVQFDGQRILWRGIKLFDDLTLRREGRAHPLLLDAPMQAHLRRMPLLGAVVGVVAPEDVVAHKLLLGRGAAEGKHDDEDAAGVVRRQQLDLAYLLERARLLNAESGLRDRLAGLGVVI
ncbi:MAG: nucleotidyltransferase family protein [Chloroflexales bacterium]|nr:nucleotidyltransferase family protein [Chloroflexales bacterium]